MYFALEPKEMPSKSTRILFILLSLAMISCGRKSDFDKIQFYHSGKQKYLAGQYEEALKDLNYAARFHTRNAGVFAYRGWVKMELSDIKGALLDFDRSLSLNPSYVRAWYGRSRLKYQLSDVFGALEDINMVIELNDEHIEGHNWRGIYRQELRQTTGALLDFSKAIALDSLYAEAWYNRGMLYLSEHDTINACRDWNMARKLNFENDFLNNKALKICNEAAN